MTTFTIHCRNSVCKNEWHIRVFDGPKRRSAYGWWIVRCNRCNGISDLYIGEGVYDSLLISGGTILQRLDNEISNVETVKDAVKKFQESKK